MARGWNWHIASFRCDAEFDLYRGIADIDQTAPIKLDLSVRALFAAGFGLAIKGPAEASGLGVVFGAEPAVGLGCRRAGVARLLLLWKLA